MIWIYFWTLTGFFLTFLCRGLAKMDDEAKVEKEKVLAWPARHGCWMVSSSTSPVWITGSGSTAILLNLRFLRNNTQDVKEFAKWANQKWLPSCMRSHRGGGLVERIRFSHTERLCGRGLDHDATRWTSWCAEERTLQARNCKLQGGGQNGYGQLLFDAAFICFCLQKQIIGTWNWHFNLGSCLIPAVS